MILFSLSNLEPNTEDTILGRMRLLAAMSRSTSSMTNLSWNSCPVLLVIPVPLVIQYIIYFKLDSGAGPNELSPLSK